MLLFLSIKVLETYILEKFNNTATLFFTKREISVPLILPLTSSGNIGFLFQMACKLATALFRCKDARQYDPQLAASLTAFFFRYGAFILERPKQCESAPSSQWQRARCYSMPTVKSNMYSYRTVHVLFSVLVLFSVHVLFS